MKRYYLEYYCGYPNIRFSFEVDAADWDDAQRQGAAIIAKLRTVACHEAKYR